MGFLQENCWSSFLWAVPQSKRADHTQVKGLLNHIYNKCVVKTIARSTRALPTERWMKETLLDCVDPMAWLIRPTVVKRSSRHQCIVVIPSIPICISGVPRGSQQLTVLEVKVSLTRNEWQKHSIVTGVRGVSKQ